MAFRSNSKAPQASSKYLLGLGAVFLMHGLIEASEEVLARIPREDPLYIDSVPFRIEIELGKGNYEEVIRLAELDLSTKEVPGWIARRIGIAYFQMGRLDEAKAYFQKEMGDFPSNSEVFDTLQPLLSSNPKRRLEGLFKAIRQGLLPPHFGLDCIAPLLCEGRAATCCFTDQVFSQSKPMDKNVSLKKRYLDFAYDLYKKFGVFSAFLPYVQIESGLCVSLRKIYFSLDRSIFDRVEKIGQASWADFERIKKGSPPLLEYLEIEGRSLGYPECCVEWALTNRRQNQPIEYLALKSLIEEEYSLFQSQVNPNLPLLAYFTFEFYPCSPFCSAAEGVGGKILKQFKREGSELSDLYHHFIFPFNKRRIFHSHMPYVQFVKDFNWGIFQALNSKGLKNNFKDSK
ncbi:MAG: hypothetical protein N3G78_01380 [Desulfobacterota bacterium]|nr:hypothetical protein [Thermodesulfobacteriota bacterium]